MAATRPTGLTVVLITGLLLGGMGVLGSLYGAVASAFPEAPAAQQEAFLDMAQVEGKQREFQERMNRASNEMMEKWRPYSVASALLNLLASGLLVAASVLLMKWSKAGPKYFAFAVLAGLIVDLVASVIGVFISYDMQTVLGGDMLAGALETSSEPVPAELSQIMDATIVAISAMSVCGVALWFLIKATYYIGALVYLRKPKVRALFTA